MLTLKFMYSSESSGHVETVFSRPSYRVRRFNHHAVITMDNADGTPEAVSHVVGGPRGAAVCFIENDAGKTIDRIGPFEAEDDASAKAA